MEPGAPPAITAELVVLGKSFRGQFLLIDGWHGVLGRNVLNNLSLLFDGPARKWMEQRQLGRFSQRNSPSAAQFLRARSIHLFFTGS